MGGWERLEVLHEAFGGWGLSVEYLLIYLFISLCLWGICSPLVRSVNVYRRHNPTSMTQPELIFSRCLLCTVMPKALSL